jgi:NAD(P)-dependent dehydrogenase (short-subunit alcohol dehydrogenase family)
VTVDPFSLAGKRVLVTGASSGIGRAIAVACAARGAAVVVTGRDVGRLDETRAVLPGADHVSICAELTDADARNALVEGAGLVHGLAHCAGIAGVRPFRQIDQRFIDEDFSINFDAPMLLTQRLLSKKQIAKGGSIVFVGSVAAHIGTIASSVYSASKGALIPAARALALEVGPKQQIRVNYVSSTYVETPMIERLREQGMSGEEKLETPPLGKGTTADIANGVVFLLSDASRWITRSTLRIDGGLTCQISSQ